MNAIAHPVSDGKLLQQFVQGCNTSLEILFVRHKDRLFTAICTLVKDRVLAEDILQETFLRVIRSLQKGRYDEQGKFLPWAMRMAHNLCMDHFRKLQKQAHIKLPDGRDISEIIGDVHAGLPSKRMEMHEMGTAVRKLIGQLSEEQREVVVLRMYADLSFKEIADLTGVSINTALGRMRYALMNLRRLIKENGVEV